MASQGHALGMIINLHSKTQKSSIAITLVWEKQSRWSLVLPFSILKIIHAFFSLQNFQTADQVALNLLSCHGYFDGLDLLDAELGQVCELSSNREIREDIFVT